ncbi:hypothetical protein BDS110ZK12_26570 [Bradyrhizobium diazoefficiens]|uniref:Uncharacterized protein n=1 Tax=Bradyrhizobium diazoefficiens TaxID=1355477 RepID=A0A810BK30_9BRAD|nr:hypothetical protein XF8B_66980 [Bradyrhizobium diazoefficiens]BCF46363.1 hypothetical protein XF16B_68530 [Bradyrhizobium diazoefficiens]BCF72516.1 hypothetical protein XF19B_68690 [Bradyrhizobium diazoefficiens]
MIGQNDGINAKFPASIYVGRSHNALHYKPTRPGVAERLKILPTETGIHLPAHQGGLCIHVGCVRAGKICELRQSVADLAERPPWMSYGVQNRSGSLAERNRKSISQITIPFAIHSNINGENQHTVTRFFGPADKQPG